MEVNIKDKFYEVDEKCYIEVCESISKRIITILYLREDLIANKINRCDIESYIDALLIDLHGTYETFKESRFMNCFCELRGIQLNIYDDLYLFRKKVLDLAGFVRKIPYLKRR